jgi:protein-L-isoaspartate O-methyltransferase
LKANGKLVIPAGRPDAQTLILFEKPSNGGVMTKRILPVGLHNLRVPKRLASVVMSAIDIRLCAQV